MTDTGSFRFPKTNSTTHRIIADLIDAGADPVSIYDSVYNQFPVSSARLKGIGYANLELYHEKRVCLMTISQKDFQITGAKEEETEGFVESLLAIQDVKVGILLIDSPKSNQIRCSFRAKADAEVRSLAEKFNGGGHAQAAGARVSGMSLEELKKIIIIESGLLFS
jgi:phosphoesterase RecJ-like protein